jgi:hypothetical protein
MVLLGAGDIAQWYSACPGHTKQYPAPHTYTENATVSLGRLYTFP